jgi:pilus assembly protein Flp/PilA
VSAAHAAAHRAKVTKIGAADTKLAADRRHGPPRPGAGGGAPDRRKSHDGAPLAADAGVRDPRVAHPLRLGVAHRPASGAQHPDGEDYMQLVNTVKSFVRNEEGQDLLEYALLVALIALVAIAAVTAAGGSVSTIFQSIADKLKTAGASS